VTSYFDEGARNGGPSDVNQLLGKSLSRHVALGDAGVKMGRKGFAGPNADFSPPPTSPANAGAQIHPVRFGWVRLRSCQCSDHSGLGWAPALAGESDEKYKL
jgi:hypothetical protein